MQLLYDSKHTLVEKPRVDLSNHGKREIDYSIEIAWTQNEVMLFDVVNLTCLTQLSGEVNSGEKCGGHVTLEIQTPACEFINPSYDTE